MAVKSLLRRGKGRPHPCNGTLPKSGAWSRTDASEDAHKKPLDQEVIWCAFNDGNGPVWTTQGYAGASQVPACEA
jgi:hypothetical protein